MRFASFNVNGIRAILKKDFEKNFLKLDADFVVLEESKYTEDLHLDFPFMPNGYQTYWTVSKVRKGYSGVTIYAKNKPLSVHYGLEDGKYDDEGRVITLEYPDFYLIGAYVPNAGEGLKRLSFRMEFEDDMLSYLKKLDAKKPIIYTGDLNVAFQEIDLKNPSSNHMNPGFTDEERGKMGILLSSGFIDSFRYLHPTEVKYSWWSYRFHARENNSGWRIDYFIVSDRIKERIKAAEIHNDIMGSDHCPVSLDIDL
ncbi:MAG: exodeoxyribonuclease III [Bacilli bacterium]|nr:exodeoxyribonuclease III [Bacilli bacterium]